MGCIGANKMNNKSIQIAISIISLLLCSVQSTLASNISASDKYAWSENVGWQNMRTTHAEVSVFDDHLEGYIWAENIGWIKLGSFSGGGSHTYSNDAANTYGVNNNNGSLSGYAWSENVGWINLNSSHGQVTIDPLTHVFDGYAWAENIGWISFKGLSVDSSAYNIQVAIPDTANDSGNTDEDNSVNIAVLNNDSFGPDGSGVLSIFSAATNGAATINNNGTPADASDDSIDYLPANNYFGNDSFSYEVADASGDTSIATVNITIAPINDSPSFNNNGDLTYSQGARGASQISWASNISHGATNESGQTLVFGVVVDDTSGILASIPAMNNSGELSLDFTGEGGIAILDITLDDGESSNNVSPTIQLAIDVTRAADLEVQIGNGVDVAPSNETVIYQVTVTNNGPADISNSSQGLITATTPAELTLQSWSCSGTACVGASGNSDLNEALNLAIGETITYHLTTTVQNNEQPISFSATAAVANDTQENNPANNNDTDSDVIGMWDDSFEGV